MLEDVAEPDVHMGPLRPEGQGLPEVSGTEARSGQEERRAWIGPARLHPDLSPELRSQSTDSIILSLLTRP